MAAEYFGNCQICGREQKSTERSLAKHGYTLRFGWQSGACYGSGHAPIQVSCDLIARAITMAEKYIATSQAQISTLNSSPLNENGEIIAYVTKKLNMGDSITDWYTVKIEPNEKGGLSLVSPDGKTIYRNLAKSHTKEEVIASLAAHRINYLAATIEEAEKSIVEMTARVENWKPAPLRPVTAADKAASAPKLHMAAFKYRSKTGICVSSAQGSQAYKMTTENREEVTCLACLKELARIDDLPRLRAEQAAKELARKIKDAERDIKEYQKTLRKITDPLEVIRYTEYLVKETANLSHLRAEEAKAAQTQ